MKLAFIYPKRFTIYPNDYLGRGLGGTESLFVILTRELAKKGNDVTVYANVYKEGVYDGVKWKSIWRGNEDNKVYDFKIILRYLEAFEYKIKSKKTILWSHDNFYLEREIRKLISTGKLDTIVVVSKYHKNITSDALQIDSKFITEIPNAYDNFIYDNPKNTNKEKYKCIYCSVPIRGLNYLIEMWDEISKIIPEAKLYITSDMTLWGSTKQDDLHVMNQLYKEIKGRKNIIRLGNITKEEVAYHQASSELMLYPTDFDELFCISALECMSVNTPIVSSYRSGIIERVDNNGILIKGHPSSKAYQKKFIKSSLMLLQNRHKLSKIQNSTTININRYTIENVSDLWNNLFNNMNRIEV